MKLVERLGGLGRVQVQGDETELLIQLLEYTSSERNEALRCGDSYPQYASDKQAFRDVMGQLFPAFPLKTDMHGQFTVIDRENNSYQRLSPCRERVISSRLPLARDVGKQGIELRIITSSLESGYFMTIALDYLYSRGVEDDLVDLFGLREEEFITGAAHIDLNKNSKDINYGIADVPSLGKVIKLYEKSRDLIHNSYTHTGITPEQLEVLRRDSLQHENIAVKELSKGRYQDLLHSLVVK